MAFVNVSVPVRVHMTAFVCGGCGHVFASNDIVYTSAGGKWNDRAHTYDMWIHFACPACGLDALPQQGNPTCYEGVAR